MDSGIEKSDKTFLTSELSKIYELKAKLEKTTDFKEALGLINLISSKIDYLESLLSVIDTEKAENDLDKLNNQILDLQEELKKTAKEYDDSCRKMQEIIEEQNRNMEKDLGLLSEEEIHEVRLKYLDKKLQENKKSILIKDKIAQISRQLDVLQENKFNTSDSSSNKSLDNDKESLLKNVEFLCLLDEKFEQKWIPSIYIATNSSFQQIKKNVQKQPEKIVDSSTERLYVPGDVPKDMVFSSDLPDDLDTPRTFEELQEFVRSTVNKLLLKLSSYEDNKVKCEASNVHIANSFEEELKSKNYCYDIVCSSFDAGSGVDDCLFCISSQLIQSSEMKKRVLDLRDSIIRELPEKDVNSLFDWYKQLKQKVGGCSMIHDEIFEGLNQRVS